jgi:hypothetical protein
MEANPYDIAPKQIDPKCNTYICLILKCVFIMQYLHLGVALILIFSYMCNHTHMIVKKTISQPRPYL